LFKKAARSAQKPLMLVDRHWIPAIGERCVREETDPDTIYRAWMQKEHSE
jgi:hypothetical protein